MFELVYNENGHKLCPKCKGFLKTKGDHYICHTCKTEYREYIKELNKK